MAIDALVYRVLDRFYKVELKEVTEMFARNAPSYALLRRATAEDAPSVGIKKTRTIYPCS